MSLRTALLAASLLATVGGLLAAMSGFHAGPVVVWGGIIFVALLIENHRYRNASAAEAPEVEEPTGERFVDPDSGVTMDVVYNPRTGERRYRAEADGNRTHRPL